jgi:hypothetical protein
MFKGFSYEDGRIVSTAYFDGYNFGDRLLEGVSFKAEVADGKMAVSFTNPNGKYEKGLNQSYWLEKAQEFAANHDIFSELPNLRGEDLALESE